ncbi:MAG: hypothetical protein MJ209_00380 [archaeon]|nr:hypothetical protein [archaeon]
MAMTGTTIFSHIIPVIFGIFGVLLTISGVMDEDKSKLILGIFLFAFACISPFIFLRLFL